MRVLTTRNVHQALLQGIQYLNLHGVRRQSRNGPVVVAPGPVTTEYLRPVERLVFWPQRDVNTAFLVAEALWMLAGRNDLAPLTRYIKDFGRYSDDGLVLHGAYGHRWRAAFGMDQLPKIARRLTEDADDRRSVLQIWDAQSDLDRLSKDLPCNDTVTFQRNADGALDMTVFNRSNDMIWGAYFANAFHFSLLQEYLACWIGCPVGRYWQVSVNFHAYLETFEPLRGLPDDAGGLYATPRPWDDPYVSASAYSISMAATGYGPDAIEVIDERIAEVLMHAETGFTLPRTSNDDDPWMESVWAVLHAHELWRAGGPRRFEVALERLQRADQRSDLVVSMTSWVARRMAKATIEGAHVR